jgi:hypothetical protein
VVSAAVSLAGSFSVDRSLAGSLSVDRSLAGSLSRPTPTRAPPTPNADRRRCGCRCASR